MGWWQGGRGPGKLGVSPFLLDELSASFWGSSSFSAFCTVLSGCLVPSNWPPPPVSFSQHTIGPWKGEVVGEVSYLPV